MNWTAKPKPEIGDKKAKIRFAFIPTRVLNKWIWLEQYLSIYEYQDAPHIFHEVLERDWMGGAERIKFHLGIKKQWVFVERQLSH